jgi:hypothetical protein
LECATIEADEPETGSYRHSVWFRWTAPADGRARLRLAEGSAGKISVFRGDGFGALEMVVGLGADVGFPVAAGEEFMVRVLGNPGDDGGAFRLRIDWLDPAPNDDFAEATDLGSAASAEAGGLLLDTTVEPGESGNGEGSLWWRWTAPFDGAAAIQFSEGSEWYECGVYQGDAVDDLHFVGGSWQSTGDRKFAFRTKAGEEYRIRVALYSTETRTGQFSFRLFADPVTNDSFAERGRLPSELPVSVSLPVFAPGHLRQVAFDRSLWWEWVAGTDGWVEVDLQGSQPDRIDLRVWMGDKEIVLDPVGLSEVGEQIWRFRARAGEVYQLQVGDRLLDGVFRSLSMVVRAAGVPVNDRFADALPMAGEQGTLEALNTGAGAEPGEPGANGAGSLWWRWTAPHFGLLVLAPGDGDWARLYEGSGLEGLSEAPRQFGTGGGYLVEAGRTYFLAAGHEAGGMMRVDWKLGPAEDLFGMAGDLGSVTRVSRSGSLAGCSREPREPFHAGEPPEQSRWYRWTAPCDGEATVSATPASGAMRVAVYQGLSIDGLREVASGTGAVSFRAVAGGEYRIAVDAGSGDVSPEYEFSLDFAADLPPGYAAWRERYFAAGEAASMPGDDPDGDGRDNLMELTLGGDPKRFDAGAAFTFDSWGGYVRLSVRRPAGLSGWHHRFEVSEDMAHWRPSTVLDRLQYIEDHGDGTETFHVILTRYRIADHPRLYFRLVAAPGGDPLGP